jgi:hypothetical protein
MTGIVLAWPNLPIIMCRGWGQAILDEDVMRTGIQAVVVKPAPKNEIVDAIRKILDEKDIDKPVYSLQTGLKV